MMKVPKRILNLAVLVGMVGALLATTSTALGEHEPTGSSLPDVGVLRLHMNADGDYFRYDPHNETTNTYDEGPVQEITLSQNCLVSLNPVDTLVTLDSPSANSVGYDDFELGIWAGGSKGVPCGLVDGREGAIVLELGTSLADKEIDYFEIDIEGKL